MAEIGHVWSELGPLVNIGDVKLLEGGQYSVWGVKKTAVPNRCFEVHSPGQGFMLLEYDGNRWFGRRLKVGPEWRVASGAFEGYMATLDLRDIEVSEVYKSLADETRNGTPFLVVGVVLAGGGILSLITGETALASMLLVFGCLGVALGKGLARSFTKKYLRLKTENGVFDVVAERFEKLLENRLRELQSQAATEVSTAQEIQPVVELRQWQMTSIVSAQ